MPRRLSYETMNTYQRTCLICGQVFFVKGGKGNKPKFCSPKCKQQAYRNRERQKKGMMKPEKLVIESDIIRLAKAQAKAENLDINFVIERLLARWLNGEIKSLKLKGKM